MSSQHIHDIHKKTHKKLWINLLGGTRDNVTVLSVESLGCYQVSFYLFVFCQQNYFHCTFWLILSQVPIGRWWNCFRKFATTLNGSRFVYYNLHKRLKLFVLFTKILFSLFYFHTENCFTKPLLDQNPFCFVASKCFLTRKENVNFKRHLCDNFFRLGLSRSHSKCFLLFIQIFFHIYYSTSNWSFTVRGWIRTSHWFDS